MVCVKKKRMAATMLKTHIQMLMDSCNGADDGCARKNVVAETMQNRFLQVIKKCVLTGDKKILENLNKMC